MWSVLFITWSKIVLYLNYYATSLPLLSFLILSCSIGIVHYKKLSAPFKLLVWYLCLSLTTELGSIFGAVVYRQNLPLLHLFTLGEFVLWTLFYDRLFKEKTFLNHYLNWILGIVGALVVFNSVFVQSIFSYNSYAKTVVHTVIICYALRYSFHFTEEAIRPTIDYKMLRVINAVVLVNYSSTLFIYMSSVFWLTDNGAFGFLSPLNITLVTVFQLIILITLWKIVSTHRKSSSLSS
ncbi:MAG: hypothetical protein RIR11_5001 [Bacteroidota bacterium]|jgi:hypothetical protein